MRALARALSVALIAAVVHLMPAGPVAHGAAAPGCVPVAIMALRGSGEGSVGPQTYKSVRTTGYEGPTLQRLLRAYAYSSAYDASIATVPIVDLTLKEGYEAVGVDKPKEFLALFATDSKIWQSASDGAAAALRKMGDFQKSQPSTCAKTQWVLVGYSQGAMVARWVYDNLPSRVASLYLVGDPFQKANQPGNIGGGANGTGVMRWNFAGATRHLDTYYSTRPRDSVSFCHNDDVICDVGVYPQHNFDGQHTNYFKDKAEKKTEGNRLALIVKAAVAAAAVPPTPTGRDVEIMFAIDTTGSMTDYIDQAVSSAEQIGNQVLAVSPGSRIGLVEYRDHEDAFAARTVVPLTRDVAAFRGGLDQLIADGGGDTPEAVYSGMLTALGAGWAPGTRRAVAVIGDAPAKDPEPVTGYTGTYVQQQFLAGGVTAAAPAVRGAAMSATTSAAAAAVADPALVFGLSADPELSAQLSAISSVTGGKVFTIDDPASVGGLMGAVVEETASAPVAELRSSPSLSGMPTVLNASGSQVSEGVARFDFDMNNDGTFELTDADPVQTVVWPAGQHTVNVKVTDSAGRFATDSLTVTTLDAEEAFGPPVDRKNRISGVRTRGSAKAGRIHVVKVAASAVPADAAAFAMLVRRDSKTPGKALAASETRSGPGRIRLSIPRRLKPGRYRIDVITSEGAYARLPVRVRQAPRFALSVIPRHPASGARFAIRVTISARKTDVVSGSVRLTVANRPATRRKAQLEDGAVTIASPGVRKKTKLRIRYLGSTKVFPGGTTVLVSPR